MNTLEFVDLLKSIHLGRLGGKRGFLWFYQIYLVFAACCFGNVVTLCHAQSVLPVHMTRGAHNQAGQPPVPSVAAFGLFIMTASKCVVPV